MSDAIREAFEALIKYRKAYDEMYQMLGMFLDAEEGLGKPDIDQAWSAFNQAPGPVYWERIEAALQSQTAPAVPDGNDAAEDVAHIFPDDLEHLRSTEGTAMVYSVPMGDPERGKTVPLYHPAPPSVAVPEDSDTANLLEQARRLQEAQYGPSAQTLTAAPQPDHYPDAGKVVHQCPRCATSMEVDESAKPSPSVPEEETQNRVKKAMHRARVETLVQFANALLAGAAREFDPAQEQVLKACAERAYAAAEEIQNVATAAGRGKQS